MNVFVVYCHPSNDSFTYMVKENFIRGLNDAGHNFVISDLYAMNFNETMSESEYIREGYHNINDPIPDDVLEEQKKIQNADVLVFIYPVFWTEAPAKLVGWFQRVWTYGFAYGNEPKMKQLEKALFLITMGANITDSIRIEQVNAMKTVMLGDRINERAKKSEMIVFDQMTRGYGNDENREQRAERFITEAYKTAFNL